MVRLRSTGLLILTLGVVFLSGCEKPRPPASADAGFSLIVEPAFPHLKFDQAVDLQHAPDGTGRLFVAEQKGVLRSFNNDPQVPEASVFLDLTDRVHLGHMEEGLLGFAFHPQFKENGFFYVYYSALGNGKRRSVVARFKAGESGKPGDPKSEFVIMEIDQPYGNHNGGQLAFGPDGYLYIGLGDGGSAGDPHNHGQDTTTLLGSILRIDVDRTKGGNNYAIPEDNPFAGNTRGDKEEIFAYGLRNPWRFSFDPKTGKLWTGDVGQDKPYEEVDIIEKGGNYGWNIMEGFQCYNPPVNCKQDGLKLPVWEYSGNEGRSITGGYVYRGAAIPALQGYYLYADFVSGRVWALKEDGNNVVNHLVLYNSNLYPSSFGVDQEGEMYICSFDGSIYAIKGVK